MKRFIKIIGLFLIFYICLASFCGCNTDKTKKIETITFNYYKKIRTSWFGFPVTETTFDKQDDLEFVNYSNINIFLKNKSFLRGVKVSLLAENDYDITLRIHGEDEILVQNTIIELKANEVTEKVLLFEKTFYTKAIAILNIAETEEQHNQKYKIKVLDIF